MMQPKGTFEIHRFNGVEIFRVSDALIMVYKDEDGVYVVNFEAETKGDAIATLPDTQGLNGCPNAEVSVKIPEFHPDTMAGCDFAPLCDNDMDGARFYYVEHDILRQARITVLRQAGKRFHVRMSGMATDVNHYDGSKPDARIEIDARFEFKDYLKWKL